MTDDSNNPVLDVEETLKKLNLKTDPLRPLTPDDVLYLLNHSPFLQIVSMGGSMPLQEVEFVTAKSNWVIHNYGDAMSSSPGKLLFRGGDFHLAFDDDDGGDDGGIVNPDKGTIWKQAFDTAQEMMALAKKLGWLGVKIIDGHPLMQWAAWMYAQDEKMRLHGYEPSKSDQEKRYRIKRSNVEDMVQLGVRPTSRT